MTQNYNLENIRALLTEGFTEGELRRLCYDEPDFRPVYDRLARNAGKSKIIDQLLEHAERTLQLDKLLVISKKYNPTRYKKHQPYYEPATIPTPPSHTAEEQNENTPAHLFIFFQRDSEPDQNLGLYLQKFLTDKGHSVFINKTTSSDETWLENIDHHIKTSDFLIVLLSQESIDNEMMKVEVRHAYEYQKWQGHPRILPIRLAYEGLLPYSIDAFLNPLQYVIWKNEVDNEQVGQAILEAIVGHLPDQPYPPSPPGTEELVVCDDGRTNIDNDNLYPPLPEYDPRFLEVPGGVVKMSDKFYIERDADADLKHYIMKAGNTVTIRAPRQTGKSSLLARTIHQAQQQKAHVINFDLQRIDSDYLETPDLFLRYMAEYIVHKLGLDVTEVENFWRSLLGPQDKLTYLMEDYVLPSSNTSLILAMDEIDRVLQANFNNDFFGLIRSWHNNRAFDEQWDKLNIVMVISTEPFLLIADVNQSPFNVGLKLFLEDFNEDQVSDLNRRYGSPVSEVDFPQLMDLLGGHPYLTRKALYTLVVNKLNWVELAKMADHPYGPFGDHLLHHYWLLHNEPTLKKTLKQIISHNRCTDTMTFFRLLQAGLVMGNSDACTCRCDLYRIYFSDKL